MKKIYYIIIAFVALSLTGCANLDIEPDGRVDYQAIFGKYRLTVNYINTCRKYLLDPGFTYTNTLLASFCDEAQDSNDNEGDLKKWYDGFGSAASFPLTTETDFWTHYYNGIYYCNNFLSMIDDPEIATFEYEPLEKTGWIAEIKVLRAYYHLQLLKRYGRIPIMDHVYEIPHDFSKDRRESIEACVDFIIGSCDEALATDEGNESIGFRWDVSASERKKVLSRAFAWAVKSQAALFAASPLFYEEGSKYTWSYVASICKEALDQCLAHGYALYDTAPAATAALSPYDYYFMTAYGTWDKETIFESGTEAKVWQYAGMPTTTGASKAGSCPTQELVDAYETKDGVPVLNLAKPYLDDAHTQPNYNTANTLYNKSNPYLNRDPRFYSTVYYNGCNRYLTESTTKVNTYVGGDCGISNDVTVRRFTRTGYYLRKFNNPASSSVSGTDGYIPVFRLAELYLNFAEAAAESAGADSPVSSTVAGSTAMTAREAVNAVRTRVGMPGLPAGLDKTTFIQRYRNERRVELAFEEHRFFDVRRWKILSETDSAVSGMKITKNGTSYTYERISFPRQTGADRYLLFPLEQSEVNKMTQATGVDWQNPGW